MKESLKDVAPLFGEMEVQLKGFKKETYREIFTAYTEKHKVFLQEVDAMLEQEDADVSIKEFSDGVIEYGAKRLEEAANKVKRENLQLNLNMFMATYLMPAILEGKHEKARILTNCLCEGWAARFKGNNIKSADVESITAGFKTKLCYVTTAVCRSLNKPEDCYELNLLKDYRDHYLIQTENGEELIKKYYDIAPTIVKRIDKSPDSEKKYSYIWEKYLKPCIAYIENGEKEVCSRTYVAMVEELQKEYLHLL